MKKFKEFWSSYFELCKQSGKWMKEHWKGYFLLMAFIGALQIAWFQRDTIKENIEEFSSTKFKRVKEGKEEL